MRHGRTLLFSLLLLLAAAPAAHADNARYALANGCYALTSRVTRSPTTPGPSG